MNKLRWVISTGVKNTLGGLQADPVFKRSGEIFRANYLAPIAMKISPLRSESFVSLRNPLSGRNDASGGRRLLATGLQIPILCGDGITNPVERVGDGRPQTPTAFAPIAEK